MYSISNEDFHTGNYWPLAVFGGKSFLWLFALSHVGEDDSSSSSRIGVLLEDDKEVYPPAQHEEYSIR